MENSKVMTKKQTSKKKIFDKISDHANKLAGLVSAVIVIISALTGVISWANSQFTNAISSQISEFRQEVKASNDAQDLAIMRLELMNLIQNSPDNTVEIEMLGKKYFNPPYNGDSYMSVVYSQWANERGLDTSFITH